MCLANRSARLSANAQYHHVVGTDCISATQLLRKSLSFLSIKMYDKTIWLSDQRQTLKVV